MTGLILPFPDFFRPDVSMLTFSTANNVKPFIHKGLSPTSGFPRECPKVQELRRQARQWLDRDKPKFSGGTCGGGE